MTCPGRNGTGITFQQFAFNLPTNATRILLRGATAMSSAAVTNSDGVTFRVFANGTKLLEEHQTNDVWRPFEFELTSLAGSNLTVRFEVDPGPNDNASCDWSLWGDRQLVLEGYRPAPISHPAPIPLPLTNLLSAQTGDVAPPSGFAGSTTMQFTNDVASFCYAGPDGVLEYQWQWLQSADDALFGTIMLYAQMTGDAPVTVPLANSAWLTRTEAASLLGSTWQQTNDSITLVRTYQVGATSAVVRVTGRMVGKSMTLSAVAINHLSKASAPETGGRVGAGSR